MWQVDLSSGAVRERTEWTNDAKAVNQMLVRASGDRSRIAFTHDTSASGAVAWYTAASDIAGERRYLGSTRALAVDGGGSTVLTGPETLVIDRDLTLRATIPASSIAPVRGLAIDAAGTAGYRSRDGKVEVIDVRRGLVTGAITVAGAASLGKLALTPDGNTLVALTDTGIGVVPVSAATADPCPLTGPATVLRVCGGPLADIVFDGSGRAYASNPQRNQIEVVNVAARTLEAPIPVGSQPRQLDVSPDGSRLAVVHTGGEDLSIVDLATRREVARWTLPPSRQFTDRSFSLAWTSRGTLLVTTRSQSSANPSRLIQFDGSGVPTHRTDATPVRLEATGDHTRVFAPDWSGYRWYDATTDTFGKPRALDGDPAAMAIDETGATLVLGPGQVLNRPLDRDTYIYDGNLVRHATVRGGGHGLALDPGGTTAYQVQPEVVELIDVGRGLVVSSIPLPDMASIPGGVALSPDGSTLIVFTKSGIALLSVATATPVQPCPPAVVPAGVARTCGPLADVVIDGTGHAFATSPYRNEVEVLSLATGALEAPIPVGSRPWGLDLSADGRTLYVATAGAEAISVVDVAQRREVRRIPVPSTGHNDRPWNIAVGDRGVALITTTSSGGGAAGRIVQLDLPTGTSRARPDFSVHGTTGVESVLEASGDRSRIAVVERHSGGAVWMYRTAEDSFGTPAALNDYLSAEAVDRTGSRVLVDKGSYVLDGALQKIATVAPTGTEVVKGVALTSDGRTGYRVLGSSLEQLDIERAAVTRTLALPETTMGAGAVALSPDGGTLAVLTAHGMVVLRPASTPAILRTPHSVWNQPGIGTFDGTGSWMGMVNEPRAAAGQLPPSYLYGHSFTFANGGSVGVVGLVADPTGKYAVFAVNGSDRVPRSAAVPFEWAVGRFYFPFVYQYAPGLWGAWVYDYTARAWTAIGALELPLAWGTLTQTTTTALSWYGPAAMTCAAYPSADAVFASPTGYVGATPTNASLTRTGVAVGDCPARTSVEADVWQRYQVGG